MALVNPRLSFFSDETQRLNNQLPQWHAGRRLRTSNWAKMVNTWYGMPLEEYKVEEQRALRNLFIQTAHFDEMDIGRRARLPQGLDLSDGPTNTTNKLRNSGFFLRSRPDKVGDFWDHTGTVTLDATALIGGSSPALRPAASSTASVQQTIANDPWPATSSRTFSAWYRIETWAGGTIPSSSHGLLVTVIYVDATTQTFRAALDSDTADQWKRVALSVTPTKTVDSYTVSVETDRSGAFDIDVPVRVDALQVQNGTTVTVWEPNLFDSPNWFVTPLPPRVHLDAEVPIHVTTNYADFYAHAVPTRAELYKVDAVSSDANRGGGIARSTDFFNRSWLYTWDIDTTNNKVRKIGINPQDIYALFDVSFFTGTSLGDRFEEDVAGQTYLSAAQFGRWLYVVHRMNGLDGNPVTVLSVCEPRVDYPSPTHVESKHTIILPIDLNDYHETQIRFEDPQHIYLNTPTAEFVIRLKYDYAIADPSTLQIFFRESYDSVALVD